MKNQDIFPPHCRTGTFVLFDCNRKVPDVQGFFPCCEQYFGRVAINMPFSAGSFIQYTEGSHRTVEVTLGGFLLPVKQKGGHTGGTAGGVVCCGTSCF